MHSLDALLDAAGKLSSPPNSGWSPSEVFQHCAQSIEFSLAGFPRHKPRIFKATIGKIAKNRFISQGRTKHNLQGAIPGAPALDTRLPAVDALNRLRESVRAFRAHAGNFAPHFAYGDATREEYERLHAMHLEEHLRALGANLG